MPRNKKPPVRTIIVIAHDMRSAHNVGSLLRTAEGLGVTKVYLTGYTPHPSYDTDPRLPHLAARQAKLIQKTALGAEVCQPWEYCQDVTTVLRELNAAGYDIVALEQAATAVPLTHFKPGRKTALLLGREVEGIDPELLQSCRTIIEIPMFGRKESFNVVQAAAMALYQIRFSTD